MKTLEQTIEAQAQAEAEAAQAQARAEAEAQWTRDSARLRREHERRCAATRAEAQSALDHEMNAIEGRNRVAVLTRKNELIDQVFQGAIQGVVGLGDEGYRAWLRAQLARLPAEEPFDLMANPRDRAALTDLLREARRPLLRMSGRSGFMKGGFIAVGKSRDLDCSIEALMGVLRDAMTERVAEMLFDGENP
jgi:vacuolar-type H+-ATPase subunit E/Vma4